MVCVVHLMPELKTFRILRRFHRPHFSKLIEVFRLGMPIGLGDLAEAAVAWEARVNELVGSDADIAAYVRQLEERDDDQRTE